MKNRQLLPIILGVLLNFYAVSDAFCLEKHNNSKIFNQSNSAFASSLRLTSPYGSNRIFYVSNKGDDSNDGLTPSTAWKTINKVNLQKFLAGDKILFRRGDLFVGQIVTNTNGVTYDAYGSGNKPVVTSLVNVTEWTYLGSNIWESSSRVSSLPALNMVLFNGVNTPGGQYPNRFATYQSHSGNNSITSSSLNSSITNWTGANAFIRINDFTLIKRKITAHSGGTLTFDGVNDWNPTDGFGFYITDDPRTLDLQNEWYYNPSTGKIRVYSASMPTGVQVPTKENIFYNTKSYTTLQNISFNGSNGTAVYFTACAKALIQNITVNHAGVNGIDVDWTDNGTIQNNTVTNVNDIGIASGGEKILISGNTIDSIGINWTENGCGIVVTAGYHTVSYNHITNIGRTGIQDAYGYGLIQYNYISNYCLRANDAGGIYTNGSRPGTRIIDHNIILNGVGNVDGNGSVTIPGIHGIYLDAHPQSIVVTNNTIYNTPRSGIKMHMAFDCRTENNTAYNCNRGLSMEDYEGNYIRRDTVRNNLFVAKASDQLALYWYTINNDISLSGIFDNNIYVKPVSPSQLIKTREPSTSYASRTIENWKSYKELGALTLSDWTDTLKILLVYNPSSTLVSKPLSGIYKDKNGVKYEGAIELKPFESALLYKIANNEPSNIPPVATAGVNETITLPINSVILTGSGTDEDGTIVSYQWTKVAGPSSFTIADQKSATTEASNLSEGTYQFEFKVIDDKGAVAKDTVQVTVNEAANIAPIADAGNNQTIKLPKNSVTLSGSGTDEDGTIASYQWTKVAGPSSFTIADQKSATTEASNLSEGTYQFEFKVIDDKGAVAKDTVQVTVNEAANIAPIADAGNNQTIKLPKNSVTLSGSGTDEDGTIASYQWTKVAGPSSFTIADQKSATTEASNLSEGTYQFEFKVIDDKGAVAKDTVQVTVNEAANIAPIADAGNNQTIKLPKNSVTLSGSGTDEDGTIASYQWTKVAGPSSFTIADQKSATTEASNLSEGTYQFEFKVIDDKGAVAKDTVQVTVNEAANIAPIADAGNNQTIKLPKNSVTLSGSGTDEDGTIASYQWTKVAGPSSFTIADQKSATTEASNLSEGTYQFEFKVIDDKGAVAKDTVQVTVNEAANIAPIADAGNNQTIKLPKNSVTLSGSGTDEDGTITSYQWTKILGPSSFTIADQKSATTKISDLSGGIYQFELKVTDNKGAVAKDTVQVNVNEATNVAPTANAGKNQTIKLPKNSVTLSGSGNDEDGTLASYQWRKISGPNSGTINEDNSSTATVTNLSEGTYQFELKVTDNKGAVAKDTIQIKVDEAENIAPTADGGNNQTIKLPANSVSLSGNGIDDDGTIASYQWTKISGPLAFTIADQKSATTKISNLSEGTYQFEFKVTDDKGAVAKDTVQVKVNEATNIAPTASAGRDQTITLPANSVTLSGSGTDGDGTIASYQWTKISGPNSGTINNANSSSATINNLSEGTYQFELKVSDNKGSVAKDTLQIRVNAANNVAPSANAGSDKTITLPVNSVVLSGTGKDSDGSISGYSWTKISGPSSFSIKNSSSPTSQISELVKGVYQLELKVTDNSGDVAKDTVQVIVMAANASPTANAGSNQTITLPTNTITLKGSGEDSDGKIAGYLWTKISGPSSFKIEKPGAAVATVSNLAEGIYRFELKVTDNDGANATDTIEVNVKKNNSPVTPPAVPVNESPVANAGNDQAITLPTNSVTLLGSGKDEDGTIASYQWTKISGPNSGTINNANSSSATGANLLEGTYQFELKVTDNKGGIGKDTVNVKVNEAANIAPVVNAGKDTTILYPASTVLLNGQAVDVGGEIASYTWKQISGPSESVIKSANTISAEMSELKEGTYEYEFAVTDNKGAVKKDSVKVTVALGRIAPEINTAITVYPNPVHDITTADINTGRPNTNVLITVSDMSGKTLYKKQMVSVSDNIKEPINMSNFGKGTYVITIFFDNVMRKSIKVLKL